MMSEEDALEQFEDAMHDSLMALPEKEGFKKAKQEFLDNIWDDVEYGVLDRMSETIGWHVRDQFERAVDAMLNGDEKVLRKYLKLDGYTGRHADQGDWGAKRDIADMHPVIHGTLFEYDGMALRKKIVEMHRDLIEQERVKDLEDQVASLTAQVNKLQQALENERDERVRRDWAGV
jgi:ribosomal protein S15P/S13E